MRHRAYRGRMVYSTNGIGEMGREYFAVTVQPEGMRTLRAHCEMDDDRLLRDVVITVDADWRPRDAFLRLTVAEQLVGTSWFRFDGQVAEAEGWTAEKGRFAQRMETPNPVAFFGTHALHCDAWVAGRLRMHDGPPESFAFVTYASSVLANGGSGPELVAVPPGFATVRDLGYETIDSPAGRFDIHHIRIEAHGVDHFDVWAAGEDCLPVRLTSDVLNQTYELVEIEGDWR